MNDFLISSFQNMTTASLFMIWLTAMFWCIQKLTKLKLIDVPLFLTAATLFLLWLLSALGLGLQMVFKL